tara:strand:- start:55 stop:363 length:309 start_codon:yes stop_codon:yes gene_type:complete
MVASERYVCIQNQGNTDSLITNFYVIEDKVVMSGVSGKGEYKIIDKNNNGLLAVNSSIIGNEFGLETVLLDSYNKTFIYKSLISGKGKNNLMKIQGHCNIFK